MNSESKYNIISSRLRAFHIKETLYNAGSFVLVAIAIAAAVASACVVLEAIFSFPPFIRTAMVAGYVIAFVVAVVSILLYVLLRTTKFNRNIIDVAYKVGSRYPDVRDNLGNALQVHQRISSKENYSRTLIDGSLNKVFLEIREKNFSELVSVRRFGRPVRLLTFIGLFAALLLLLIPGAHPALSRLMHYNQDYDISTLYSLHVLPGDTTVVRGSDVEIKSWTDLPDITELRLTADGAVAQSLSMTRQASDTFSVVLRAVQETMNYKVMAGKLESQLFSVRVVDRPILRQLQAKVGPPAYSKQQPYFLDENVGDISALKGTRVELNVLASKELQQAQLLFEEGRTLNLDVYERRASGSFVVQNNTSYSVLLTDTEKLQNEKHIKYYVKVIPDHFPFVKITSPGQDIDLGDDMMIPVGIEASDDYGLGRIQLAYQLIPEGAGEIDSGRFVFQDLGGFEPNSDYVTLAFPWDLSSSDMMPTDVLAYFVRAYDNDAVSGPKKSDSKMYHARFPSLYELYQEMAMDQDQAIETAEEVYQKAQELQKKMEEMSIEMRRAEEVNWEQQQQIKDALKTQQQLHEQMDELSKKLDEMVSTMEKNDLVSVETLRKYQELQELVQEIMTPELQEAMQKLGEAMKNLDQRMVQKALEELKLSQESFNKSLDRSIALLKKLKAEQKLDQLVKMSEELLERQTEQTESLQDKKSDKNLSDDQRKINQDIPNLTKALSDLQKELEELPGSPKEELEEAALALEDSSFAAQMDSLKKNLEQNNLQEASRQSYRAQQRFEKVSEKLQSAKDMMSGAMQMQMMQAMMQATRDLLELSQRQETLLNETREAPANSPHLSELAEQQNNLASALQRSIDQMFEASKKNVFMNSDIGMQLGRALSGMKESLKQMEGQTGTGAVPLQGEALNALNDAFQSLQNSMQQMMQGRGGGGMSMEQFMQQMQQLGQQQQGINQQTQALGAGQQMSLARQAAMARLAAEQQQVRKSAEQLAKEAGNLDRVLGDMEKIVDEMKEVEKDFVANNLTRETIERQNRILSRMLDAQKSMREREYSNKRKAETGKFYTTQSPDALPSDLGDIEAQLQRDLLRAKKEGYTKDYLDMIKKYFEALSTTEEYAN